jgi:multidrug efflux system membrane fusion protein
MKSDLIAVLAVCLLASCTKDQGGPPKPGGGKGTAILFPVEVQRVEVKPLHYAITAVGSLEAFERVQVTARVAGVVERIRFREGDSVKDGQTLVEIEPERYRLEIDEKRAMLERADAALADAETSMKRRVTASQNNPGLIRGEEMESFRMRERTAKADQLAAKTALAKAELDLRDALVKSPIAAVVQTRTVQTGQYVQPGTVLATMIRRDPMLLRFKVPVRDAEPLKPGLTVEFHTRSGGPKRSATITLVTDIAEESSRMVAVTAEVDAKDREELRPGSFAQININHGAARDAPVIPQTAIRPSERGFLAYVVEDGVAKERVLELGVRTPDGQVEIVSGLQPGDTLVIRGSEALKDSVKVRVEEAKNARAGS